MRTLPAAVSTLVDELVRGPVVTGRVLTLLPSVAYVEVAGTVVPVETSLGIGLPTAVRVAAVTPPWDVTAGAEVGIGEGELVLGGLVLRVVRAWQPPVVRACADASVGDEVLAALPSAVPLDVDGLVGRGPGLTPSGDDVLCGALLTLLALGDVVATARLWGSVAPRLGATTSVSASLLTAASTGHALAVVRDLVHAVAADDAPTVQELVPQVERIGHSSGRDLLVGVATAAVRHERPALVRAH